MLDSSLLLVIIPSAVPNEILITYNMSNTYEAPKAIIGGTGFSEIATDFKIISTDYGDVPVGQLELGGKEVHFLARHRGLETPDRVNYRANLQALKLLGVNTVFAVSAAGRLAEEVWPGHLVVLDDVDWDDTTGRHRDMTFSEPGLLLHASMNDPFSQELRRIINSSWLVAEPKIAKLYQDDPDLKVLLHTNGTFFNVNGPSFSPPAREARIRSSVFNPKLIGQTLVPEVILAREMAMAYAAVGMCVDHSNFPGAPPVTHADGVMNAVVKTAQAAIILLDEAVKNTPPDFFDGVAHDAFNHSLHSNQVDLSQLRHNGRTHLALILEGVLTARNS